MTDEVRAELERVLSELAVDEELSLEILGVARRKWRNEGIEEAAAMFEDADQRLVAPLLWKAAVRRVREMKE